MTMDDSICVDDDCPLPEHTGPCPDERTLEMWRAEAKRCRKMIGLLLNMAKTKEQERLTLQAMLVDAARKVARLLALLTDKQSEENARNLNRSEERTERPAWFRAKDPTV